MDRSKWMKSLMAALASTGLAMAQQYPETVDISEAGKAPRRCMIMECQRNADGSSDYTMRDVKTGQLFLLHKDAKDCAAPGGGGVTSTAPLCGQPGATGTMPVSQGGASLPAAAQATPSTLPPLQPTMTSTPAAPCLGSPAPEQLIMVHEEGHQPEKARILQTWLTERGQRAYLGQFIETKELVTILESKKSDGHNDLKGAIGTQFYHWGPNNQSPVGAPQPPKMDSNGPDSRVSGELKSCPPTDIKVPGINRPLQKPPVVASTTMPPKASASEVVLPTMPTKPAGTPSTMTLPGALPLTTTAGPKSSGSGSGSGAPTVKPGSMPVVSKPPAGSGPCVVDGKGSASVVVATPTVTKPAGSSSSKDVPPTSQGSGVAKGSSSAPWARIGQALQPGSTAKGSGSGSATRSDPLLNPQEFKNVDGDKKVSGAGSGTKPAPVTTASTQPSTGSDKVALPPGMAGSGSPKTTVADAKVSQPARPPVEYVPVNQGQPTLPNVKPGSTPAVGGQPTLPPQRPVMPSQQPAQIDVENAFTHAVPQQPQQEGMPYNAFAREQGAMPQQPMAGGQAMGMPMPYGMPYLPPMQSMPPRPMMPPMPYNGTAMPAQFTQQQMMQPGYYMPPQGMPMAGGMAMGMPGYPVPQQYMPQPQPYNPQPGGGAPGVAQVSVSMPASVNEGALPNREGMTVPQMTRLLQDALYPSHREWAADQLGSVDCKSNPQVVNALVLAANEDPASGVRTAAVHSLGRMNANQISVIRALQSLRSDNDPMLHSEVEKALAKLAPAGVGGTPELVPAKAEQK